MSEQDETQTTTGVHHSHLDIILSSC